MTPVSASASVSYRPDIDGLRALAVLAVIFNHAGFAFIPGGFAGVDIFFVISGYLITQLIMRDLQNGAFSMAGFWERRVRRILPPLLVMLVVTLAAAYVILLPYDFAALGQQVLFQGFFSSNFLFAAQSGYFDSDAGFKPLLHTWSLAVEEQFYLLYPFLVALLWRWRTKAVAPALLLIFVTSFAGGIYGFYFHPKVAFYLLPTRAWELALGALVFFTPAISLQRLEKEMLGLAAFGWIVTAVFICHDTGFLLLPSALACLGTAGLIWLGRDHATWTGRLLAARPLAGIGLISYSLYLWHWPLLVFARYTNLREPATIQIATMLALTFATALLSTWLIEKPVRAREILNSRASAFIVLLGCLAALACTGAFINLKNGFPARAGADVAAYSAVRSTAAIDRSPCHFGGTVRVTAEKFCRLGEAASPVRFVSFGDSFAQSLQPVLEKLSLKNHVAGLQISHDTCPPTLGLERPGFPPAKCRDFTAQVMDYVLAQGIGTVILSARWSAYGVLYQLQEAERPASLADTPALLNRHLVLMIENLRQHGVEIWIVAQQPEYPLNVPLRQAQTQGQVAMTRADYDEQQAGMTKLFRGLAGPHVHIIDPAGRLCDARLCVTQRDGVPFYRDHAHFSAQGAELLEPLFASLFETLPQNAR